MVSMWVTFKRTAKIVPKVVVSFNLTPMFSPKINPPKAFLEVEIWMFQNVDGRKWLDLVLWLNPPSFSNGNSLWSLLSLSDPDYEIIWFNLSREQINDFPWNWRKGKLHGCLGSGKKTWSLTALVQIFRQRLSVIASPHIFTETCNLYCLKMPRVLEAAAVHFSLAFFFSIYLGNSFLLYIKLIVPSLDDIRRKERQDDIQSVCIVIAICIKTRYFDTGWPLAATPNLHLLWDL